MSSSSKHFSSYKSHSRSTEHSRLHSSSASSSSRNPSHSDKRSSYWDTVLEPDSRGQSSRHHDDDRRRETPKSVQRECPRCRRSFSSTRSFEEHLSHCPPGEDKPFACTSCGTAFKKNSNLVKHMKLVHLRERKFACQEPGCGRLFGQKSNLNSHVRAVHLKEKPFICTEPNCGRRFSQKSGLKAHVKTVHNGERPYKCECGSAFGHRGDVSFFFSLLRLVLLCVLLSSRKSNNYIETLFFFPFISLPIPTVFNCPLSLCFCYTAEQTYPRSTREGKAVRVFYLPRSEGVWSKISADAAHANAWIACFTWCHTQFQFGFVVATSVEWHLLFTCQQVLEKLQYIDLCLRTPITGVCFAVHKRTSQMDQVHVRLKVLEAT